MILSGTAIHEQLGKNIFIDPFDEKRLNPNSYNLRLHNELLVYENQVLDMRTPNPVQRLTIPEEGLLLEPGKLYLGRTVERTRSETFAPKLEGRSSIGRLGIFIHITAGLGHVGANGFWTLEISCVQPVRVYPFVEFCQIYFFEIKGAFKKYESGKYHNNEGIQPSLLYKEFENGTKENGNS